MVKSALFLRFKIYLTDLRAVGLFYEWAHRASRCHHRAIAAFRGTYIHHPLQGVEYPAQEHNDHEKEKIDHIFP